MKNALHVLMLLLCASYAHAQAKPSTPIHAGLELDALPYLTGGYFAAACVGKGPWRLRVLTADVHKPDWSTAKGFSKHHVTAYAFVVDRFLKPDWKGWWIGAGPVYWKSEIQTDAHVQKSRLENILLNGSLGYNFTFGRHFYVSPWAGMSLRVAGDKNVAVDDKKFTLPLLNPEASLKLGFYF
jgi:hypothetical protein